MEKTTKEAPRYGGERVGEKKGDPPPWFCTSISFPPDIRQTLKEIAKQKKPLAPLAVRTAAAKCAVDRQAIGKGKWGWV